jgi:hypothetical protein
MRATSPKMRRSPLVELSDEIDAPIYKPKYILDRESGGRRSCRRPMYAATRSAKEVSLPGCVP